MRVLIEFHPGREGRVTGVVVPEGFGTSGAFSGWLELLRLLEAWVEPEGSESDER